MGTLLGEVREQPGLRVARYGHLLQQTTRAFFPWLRVRVIRGSTVAADVIKITATMASPVVTQQPFAPGEDVIRV